MMNTELACCIDSGEENNIHPTEKRLPGTRLAEAWLAWHGDIGRDRLCPGIISCRRLDPHRMLLKTDLPLREENGARCFELRAADGKWLPAAAAILKDSILLTCMELTDPVAARYAWFNWGEVNVFGENGRPLMPYRSDI